jgi:hypothetical protein
MASSMMHNENWRHLAIFGISMTPITAKNVITGRSRITKDDKHMIAPTAPCDLKQKKGYISSNFNVLLGIKVFIPR